MNRESTAMSGTGENHLTAGEFLRQEMTRLGLDQIKLAATVKVSRQTVNNIINGRQSISRAMAAKLADLTGRTSDFWLMSRFPAAGDPSWAHGADAPSGPVRLEARRPAPAEGPSVLVDWQITEAVERDVIGIDPFDPANVRSASVDLTLDDFVLVADGSTRDISGEGSVYMLPAGQTVYVNTVEEISFPDHVIGRVGAMTELARYGIFLAHGFQIDPGFRGQLQFCLFNAGSGDFPLSAGQRIISLEICPLAAPPKQPWHGEGAKISDQRDEVHQFFRLSRAGNVCAGALRERLLAAVETERTGDRVVARIPALKIELVGHETGQLAESAVDMAFDMLAAADLVNDTGDRHVSMIRSFFEDTLGAVLFDADQVSAALALLGAKPAKEGRSAYRFSDGSTTIVALPGAGAQVPFGNFALQVGLDVAGLAAALTRPSVMA